MPPWEVLDLNVSAALDASAVRRAFSARARVLSPDRNPACLARAGREYVAARRARDTLLLLASVAEDAQVEGGSASDPRRRLKSRKPFPLATKGRWGSSMRKHRRVSRPRESTNLGKQLSLVVAIKLALYRLLRDYKTRLARGWWGRARHVVREVLDFGRRATRALYSFCRANSALLFVTLLAVTMTPVLSLA